MAEGEGTTIGGGREGTAIGSQHLEQQQQIGRGKGESTKSAEREGDSTLSVLQNGLSRTNDNRVGTAPVNTIWRWRGVNMRAKTMQESNDDKGEYGTGVSYLTFVLCI